jgi:hypothetical protein
MAAIAATEKEPERKDENPEPTTGAPAPTGYSPYDDKGNYIPPGYEIER